METIISWIITVPKGIILLVAYQIYDYHNSKRAYSESYLSLDCMNKLHILSFHFLAIN